jgi:hypothetical protein
MYSVIEPIVLDVARCPHCPIERGLACEGLRVRRLCELVDPTHPAYNPEYLSLLGPLASSELPEALVMTEALSLLKKMKACPERTVGTDCGCAGLARCALGKGHNGLVNHFDCFDCLRTASSDPGARKP